MRPWPGNSAPRLFGVLAARRELRLGHLFQAAGLVPDDVAVIRHTLTSDGLTSRQDATGPKLLAYTREQGRRNNKLGKTPPRIWLNFLAATGRRARFLTAYENHGEVLAERTDLRRFFDLRPSPMFSANERRLVIETSPCRTHPPGPDHHCAGPDAAELAAMLTSNGIFVGAVYAIEMVGVDVPFVPYGDHRRLPACRATAPAQTAPAVGTETLPSTIEKEDAQAFGADVVNTTLLSVLQNNGTAVDMATAAAISRG